MKTLTTDEEWIQYLNNVEHLLFMRSDYYNCGVFLEERIRSHWDRINGYYARVVLDFQEMQWVGIYMPCLFHPRIIGNPESIYWKEQNNRKN